MKCTTWKKSLFRNQFDSRSVLNCERDCFRDAPLWRHVDKNHLILRYLYCKCSEALYRDFLILCVRPTGRPAGPSTFARAGLSVSLFDTHFSRIPNFFHEMISREWLTTIYICFDTHPPQKIIWKRFCKFNMSQIWVQKMFSFDQKMVALYLYSDSPLNKGSQNGP